jgi:hypothetical protein
MKKNINWLVLDMNSLFSVLYKKTHALVTPVVLLSYTRKHML